MNWKQYPFIRLFLPFCLGIVTAINYPSSNFSFYWIALLFIVTIVILILSNKWISYQYRWLPGVLIMLFLFFSGFTLCCIHNEYHHSTHFSKLISGKGLYTAGITEPPEIKDNSVKVVVQVKQGRASNMWVNCSGSMVLYLQKDSNACSLQYGDLLMIHADPNEIRPPQNPSEFNYKRYLAHKNIFHQSYLKQHQWQKVASGKGHMLKAFATSLRQKLLHIFEENNITGREYAVISAILLGQTDKIDPELIKAYSGSGAVHVLAVSGMHVGLIFISLSIALSFLDKVKHGKMIKALLILLAIWFYALLTGMSPSVIRATTMLSFIVIGKSLRRNADTLNILFASAFFILLFNPFLISSVGFQLSYLAVGGILLINEAITGIFTPDNFLLKKCWEISSVSISAQLITSPLSMLYFHQFPNYFLLTNVVVFIFAAVVMYAGIVVLLVSFIPYVSTISAQILVYLVYGMNQSISIIEGLPYSVSRGIQLNNLDAILLYLLIFALILLFFQKAKRFAFIALSMVLLLFTSFTYQSFQHLQQKKLIVYAIPKTSAYEFINGKYQIILSDSSLMKDDSKFGFHIQNYHTLCGISTKSFITPYENYKNETLHLNKQQNFIQFYNQRIAIVTGCRKNQSPARKLKLDYLILSGNAKTGIEDLLRVFEPGLIVFDASNAQWKTEKWEKECVKLQKAYYNVVKMGALVVEVKR